MNKRERKLQEDLTPVLDDGGLMAVTLHQPEAAQIACGQVRILLNPRGFKLPLGVQFLLIYSSTNRRHWSQAANHMIPHSCGTSGAYGSLLGIVELKESTREWRRRTGRWNLKVRARFVPPIIASAKARAGYWMPELKIQQHVRSLIAPARFLGEEEERAG